MAITKQSTAHNETIKAKPTSSSSKPGGVAAAISLAVEKKKVEEESFDYLNQMNQDFENEAFTDENLAEETKLLEKEKPKTKVVKPKQIKKSVVVNTASLKPKKKHYSSLSQRAQAQDREAENLAVVETSVLMGQRWNGMGSSVQSSQLDQLI